MTDLTKREYKALAEYYAAVYVCHDELEKTDKYIDDTMSRSLNSAIAYQDKRDKQRTSPNQDFQKSDLINGEIAHDRDHSYFVAMSQEQVIQLLAKLEKSGELATYAKEHFPDYLSNGQIQKFTLISDLGL